MIITESQLRLIVRQELLEVLNENDTDLLEEGLKQQLINLGLPIAMAFGLGGSIGTAAHNIPSAISGGPGYSQVMSTIGGATTSNKQDATEELAKIEIEGKIVTHKDSGMTYNGETNMLTYKGVSVAVPDNILIAAKTYVGLSKSRSGKYGSSNAETFLNSNPVRTKIEEFVKTNPELNKAINSQTTMNLALVCATMFSIFCAFFAIVEGDMNVAPPTDKKRTR